MSSPLTPENTPSHQDIERMYSAISDILSQAKNRAALAVNHERTLAYWNIGRVIVEEEQEGNSRAEYGKALLKGLSARLSQAYGKGFSTRQLRHIRAFYLAFPKWNAVRSELSWTHYRLLTKIESEAKRAFYLKEATERYWSSRELEHQIHIGLYERHQIAEVRQVSLERREPDTTTPADLLKDPYLLHFLGLEDKPGLHERDIEQAIIDNLQQFLLELGKGFAFVGRQVRFTLEGDHYYIDLVFYNYILKCFVLIDLKAGKITPQDVGQMDFYVRYWQAERTHDGDNQTIGLILGDRHGQAVAQYTLLQGSEQIFASQYQLYLPSEEELQSYLSTEKERLQLEQRLDNEKEPE